MRGRVCAARAGGTQPCVVSGTSVSRAVRPRRRRVGAFHGARPRLASTRPSQVWSWLVGLLIMPFALPVLPVDVFVRYQNALGMAPRTEERQEMGLLPQQYADMFGWEEMAALVGEAY